MEINDIRPNRVMKNARNFYIKDVNFYKLRENLFIPRACPAGCAAKSLDNWATHHTFKFSHCLGCGAIYMNPGPSEALIGDFYLNSENYKYWSEHVYPMSAEGRLKNLILPRAQFIFNFVKNYNNSEKLNILEFGAGTGDVARSLSEMTQSENLPVQIYAVEPNSDMKKFSYEGTKVIHLQDSLKDALINLKDQGILFDLIYSFEVVEHLKDPLIDFKLMSSRLNKEGRIVFSTPNAHSLEVMYLRERSTTIDIEHISLLTPRSVQVIAEKCNLECELVVTPGTLDLELIARASKATWAVFIFIRWVFPKQIERIQNFISQNLLSSHSRYVLVKNLP